MSKEQENKDNFKLVLVTVLSAPLILQMFFDLFGAESFMSLGILIVCATVLQTTISHFYYELFLGLKKVRITIEGLVALSSLALWGASVILWVTKGAEVGAAYAAVNAIAIPLALYGRQIAGKITSPLPKGRDDEYMMPRDARLRQKNGIFEKVPLGQIRQGDLIQIMAGEICPVDGAVVEGVALFTAVELNADPMPRHRSRGDNILAGENCFGGTVVVKAIRAGYESRLSDACGYARLQSRFDQTSRFVDKYLNPFVLVILVAALINGLIWLGLEGIMSGALMALATFGLSVAAGFGLLSALPQFLGAEYLRTKGILIHKEDIVETARNIDRLYVSPVDMFIMRNPKVGGFHTDADETLVLSIIFGMLKKLNHPLLKPVELMCDFKAVRPANVRKVFFDSSRGITAEYDDRLYLFGNPALLSSQGVSYHKFRAQVTEMEARGDSVFWLAQGKPKSDCVAVISFQPAIRASAKDAVVGIKDNGISVDLLSQFANSKSLKQLEQIGLSNMFPTQNSIQLYNNVVQAQVQKETVCVAAFSAMDMPAVQAADLTIMAQTGPSMLLSYATITLSNADPERLASAVNITRFMGQNIARNLKIAFGFSALVIGLGGFNLLSPFVAQFLALISAAAIGINSYMVKSKK